MNFSSYTQYFYKNNSIYDIETHLFGGLGKFNLSLGGISERDYSQPPNKQRREKEIMLLLYFPRHSTSPQVPWLPSPFLPPTPTLLPLKTKVKKSRIL